MFYDSLTDTQLVILAILVAGLVALAFTPFVRRFAISIGAIDKPRGRHIHKRPVPKMGGIAIVVAFFAGALLFADLDDKVKGVLLGALIIAVMGAVDDVKDLKPWLKLIFQIIAAVIAIHYGVVLDGITSLFGTTLFLNQTIATVLTLLWIVICTNAMNLIDGMDGLACSIAAISAFTMMVVSLLVSDLNITILLGCVLGACLGFLPYNINPAKIFMGDVGSQTLGFLLATISTMGLFKMHAVVTILVPLFALAVPLADTVFAIIRRLWNGQSPFVADGGHFHHRLLALGLTQRQVVGILCSITLILGLISILMTESSSTIKIICTVAVFLVAVFIWLYVRKKTPDRKVTEMLDNSGEPEEDVRIYQKESKSDSEGGEQP